MKNVEFLYLKQEEVIEAGVLDVKKTLEELEAVFRIHGKKQLVMPVKSRFRFDDASGNEIGHIVSMPAYIGADVNVAGLKWAAGFWRNPTEQDLPLGMDLIILSDPNTGKPKAIMDGTIITAIRTAGTTALAAKYLARTDSKIAAIYGAGIIGWAHLHAFLEVFNELEEIKLYDIDKRKTSLLTEKFEEGIVQPMDRARDAAIDSDIIMTCTTSQKPFLREAWLKKGRFVAHVGSNEIEIEVARSSDRIVVDEWAQIKYWRIGLPYALYAEGKIREEEIINLGDILLGEKPGRTSNQESIYFKSFGMACEDIIVANRIYNEALKLQIGKQLSLWDRWIGY